MMPGAVEPPGRNRRAASLAAKSRTLFAPPSTTAVAASGLSCSGIRPRSAITIAIHDGKHWSRAVSQVRLTLSTLYQLFRKQNLARSHEAFDLHSMSAVTSLRSCWMPSSVSSTDPRVHWPVGVREAQCPNCNQPVVCAEANASFDSHGFESYQLDCEFCETPLDGIVDPFDDALLLTARVSHSDRLRRSA